MHNDFSETATNAEETNFSREPTWHDIEGSVQLVANWSQSLVQLEELEV